MPASVRPVRDDLHLYGVGPRGAWLALRSLATMHREGWARYVAALDPGRGHHVLDVTPGGPPSYREVRILPRFYTATPRPAAGQFGAPGQAWWFGVGVEDHHGPGGVMEALVQERAPKLLAAADVADMLGISPPGVRALHESYRLYPVYVVDPVDHRTRRMAFEAQVKAHLSASARSVDRWRQILGQLPDLVRVDTIAERVTLPEPAADPGLPSPTRSREALAAGHEAAWYRVTYRARDSRYVVRLADGRTREVPDRAVEPWLAGLAAARGSR